MQIDFACSQSTALGMRKSKRSLLARLTRRSPKHKPLALVGKMNHQIAWRGLFIVAISIGGYDFISVPAYARPEKCHFKVEISIDAASVRAQAYFRTGRFYVNSTVTNVSARKQVIAVWTQYGWSWLSDRPQIVSPGIEALKNLQSHIALKSGQSHSGKIEMWSRRGSPRAVSFRLGFVRSVERPISSEQRSRIRPGSICWSNRVTLAR